MHQHKIPLTQVLKSSVRAGGGTITCPICNTNIMHLLGAKSKKPELYCDHCHASVALWELEKVGG